MQPKYLANGKWRKETPEGAEVETAQLLASIVRHQKPERCLETGSAWGQSAEAIGQALRDNGSGRLWTCDIGDEQVAATRARCAGLPVEVCQQTGISLINESDHEWNWVFIDSWWQPVRIEEVEAVIPKIAAGGFLCLHDVCQNYGHVYGAALKTGWLHLVFHAPYGLAVFQKPSADDCIGAGRMVTLDPIAPTF